MANSFTGMVDTQSEFVTLDSDIMGFDFTSGNTYTMQIINNADLKLGDAVFSISNERFQYKASSDELMIRTNYNPCTLTVYEQE